MYAVDRQSSNIYYYSLANEMGVDAIHDFWSRFGFGRRPASTSRARSPACCRRPSGSARPTSKPEQQKWYAGETISLGIGQGYNNFTMLQLASATATLVVRRAALQAAPGARDRGRGDAASARVLVGDALPPLPLKPEHVALIHQALYGVTQEGTSARVVRSARRTRAAARPAPRR